MSFGRELEVLFAKSDPQDVRWAVALIAAQNGAPGGERALGEIARELSRGGDMAEGLDALLETHPTLSALLKEIEALVIADGARGRREKGKAWSRFDGARAPVGPAPAGPSRKGGILALGSLDKLVPGRS